MWLFEFDVGLEGEGIVFVELMLLLFDVVL